MFLSNTTSEAAKRESRIASTLHFMREGETPDGKLAVLYADFTEWGLRVEQHLVVIKRALICIAVLMVPVALRACERLS